MKTKIDNLLKNIFPSINGEIDENWGPDDIKEWDSLNHLNMVLDIEKQFNISLELEEVLSIEKIKHIYEIIEKKR